jgi:hypothetical protein
MRKKDVKEDRKNVTRKHASTDDHGRDRHWRQADFWFAPSRG